MKRLLSACLAALMLLSLAACGAPQAEEPQDTAEVLEPQPIPEPPPPTPEELAAQVVEETLADMTLAEKVGQLFFVRCPAESAVEDVTTYHLGGYILFGSDFQDSAGNWLTREQFTETIAAYQSAALADTGIPLLVGSDEEGGSVTRASRNPNLFDSKFKSPQALAKQADDPAAAFAQDAREKSQGLLALGINVNLAPVADVSTDPNDFIYDRTLGQDSLATGYYVATVVDAMEQSGMGSVLKHFPGYGNNVDTHTGIAQDNRPYAQFFNEDFEPFRAGISEGRRENGQQTAAVLMSHNIVACMDESLPASLSPEVHRVLRQELGFEGVIMTDDLAMEAVAAYAADGAVAVMAIEAGNDLVITGDYRTQIPKVIAAVESGALAEETIDEACRRVLQWKQALDLLPQVPETGELSETATESAEIKEDIPTNSQ